MRVLFVTEDDPLYVIHFFDVFLREHPRHEVEVVAITIERPFHESPLATTRRVLRLYGARDFLRLLARVGAAKARGRSIGSLARREAIPVLRTRSVNDASYVDELRRLAPDVIVSVAAPEIFGAPLLACARLACVNVHSGRLPKYRGMMPTFWQLLHRERCVTVTVHEMVPKLDAGAILATAELPVAATDSLARLMIEGKRQGARLVIGVLRALAAGTVERRPLDMSEASYFTFPGRAEARRVRRMGHALL